ncbi:hypothetical protein MHBO_004843 [Bonamia ostreae]|uniref:Uncharacterized protein n=1 Tax=Bonamia ostreae TaxID=126728 RepID=A0ABV2AV00_9EUKA
MINKQVLQLFVGLVVGYCHEGIIEVEGNRNSLWKPPCPLDTTTADNEDRTRVTAVRSE